MMLICKIIQTGKLRDVIEYGISQEDFLGSETKALYQRVMQIYQHPDSSGSVIGPALAKEHFPHLPLTLADEHVTVDHLCSEVRRNRLAAMMNQTITEAGKALANDNDIHGALSSFKTCIDVVHRIDTGKQTDVHGAKGFEAVLDSYNRQKSGEDNGVVGWAWYELTKHAGPIADDDYIIFYGRPKNMKTWMLLVQAAYTIFIEDVPAVIYTKEMTAHNLFQRLASIATRIAYGPMKRAMLDPMEEKRWFKEMKEYIRILKEKQERGQLWVLSGKDVSGKDTISWLRSKVEKYKPKICFVDGLYLMSPENPKLTKSHERLENVSRAARAMILDTHVPLICTLQANRKAAEHNRGELDEIAMSDAFSQDCTAAIRCIKDKKKTDDGQQTTSLIIAGSREWTLDGMRVYAEPSTNFNFHSYLDEKAINAAKQQDVDEDAKGSKKNVKAEANAMAGKIAAETLKAVAGQMMNGTFGT